MKINKLRDLQREIQIYAKKHNLNNEKLTQEFAMVLISQMLPANSYLKGGNALAFKYENVRDSHDLDIVFKTESKKFEKEFSKKLKSGIGDFTGKIKYRKQPKNTNMPTDTKLLPINIQLFFKKKIFRKIETDTTFDLEYDNRNINNTISYKGIDDLLNYLGLNIAIEPIPIISTEKQLAQKLQGIAQENLTPRYRDLIDIGIILNNDFNNIDYSLLKRYIKAEYEINNLVFPPNFIMIKEKMKNGYSELSFELNRQNIKTFSLNTIILLSQTLISKTPEIIKELLKLDLDYIVRNYNSPVHKFDKKIIKFNNKYPKIAKTLFIPKRQTNQYNAGFVKSHYRIINDKKVWIKKHNRKPRNNT